MKIKKGAIIKYIVAIMAALNLIWLFGFGYKMPSFLHLPAGKEQTEEAAAAATTAEAAEPVEETAEEEEEEEQPEEVQEVRCRVTAASNLNVRSGPGTNYEVVTSAAYDEILTVLAVENDWVRIRTSREQEGYVSAQYIEILED